MKTAKAAVFTAVNEPFEIREFPLVAPPPGMAKMRLLASGVCGTDIHIHRGKLALTPPLIIGHEFIGRVEEIAPEDQKSSGISAGDNVIVDIASPCGECLLCRTGDDANCVHMGVTNAGHPDVPPHLYGGYAEVNYSPVKNLIPLPAELDPKMACVFACAGPTTLHAFALAQKAGVDPGQLTTAVVQGFGPVGAFAVLYLSALGVKNIAVVTSRQVESRSVLARGLGATEILSVEKLGEQGLVHRIQELTGGLGADLAIEASGNPAAFVQGLAVLRNRGAYLVPGQYSNSGGVEIQPQLITFKALHIIGSSQYQVEDVKSYIRFLQQHPNLHNRISSLASCYAVWEINRAIEDTKAGKNIKTLLV